MMTREVDDLPKRIQEIIFRHRQASDERLLAAVRTGYRLSIDHPFAWFILSDRQLLICSTYRRQGELLVRPLDRVEIRFRQKPTVIEILPQDVEGQDYSLPIADLSEEEEASLRASIESVMGRSRA